MGIGLVAVLGLTAVACGDDSGSKASSTTAPSATATTAGGSAGAATTAAPAAGGLGTPNKATGTPLTVGFAYDGKTEAIDNTGDLKAAQAAADYINNYQGGIGGHPIELKDCPSLQQPATAVQCDNQFIASKLPAVLADTSGVADSFAKGLSDAGIPQWWVTQLTTAIQNSPTATVLTNPLAANYAAPAKIAQEAGATNATELVIDVPAAADPAKQLMTPMMKNAGVTLDVVPIPPGTADMTPQVSAALAKKPGLVHITGNDTFCISAMQALKTLNYTGKIVVIPQCISQAFLKTLKGQLDGVILTTAFNKDPADPEVALYKDIMSKYAPDTDANGSVAYGGYASVLGFGRALKDYKGELTPAAIAAAIKAMPESPMPLANGLTYKCDRTAVSFFQPICSTGALQGSLDANGTLGPLAPIDVKDLLHLN